MEGAVLRTAIGFEEGCSSMSFVSSFTSSLACSLGRHEPMRRGVEWDGRHYVGECKHCGKAIERVAHRHWRERAAQTS